MEIIITRCFSCHTVIGCYSSLREVKKIYCLTCEGAICPSPNKDDSHGLCKRCYLQGKMVEEQK